jgi:Eco57I restriction-modification methylase
MESFKELKSYLKTKFASHDERSDLYSYFVEQGHRLLRVGGRFGMIVSNKFLRANYGKPLRDFLSRHTTVERIVDFAGLPVFAGATVRTLVLLTRRRPDGKEPMLYSPPLIAEKFLAVRTGALSVDAAVEESAYEVSPEALSGPVWSFTTSDADAMLGKLKREHQSLAEYCEGQICRGVVSGLTKAFVIDEQTQTEIVEKNPEAKEIIKPFLNGRNVRRYWIDWKDTYLIYTHHGVEIANPVCKFH